MADVYNNLREALFGIKHPVIFELGVNEAQDTVRLLEEFKPSKYIGFECDPYHIENIKEKNLPIQLIEAAVSIRTGTAILFQSWCGDVNTGSSSIRKPKNHLKEFKHVEFPKKMMVKTISLDDVCQQQDIHHIDFIWADIQGAEIDMIKGGQRTLSTTRFLLTEYSNNELYEGQVGLAGLMRALPGKWKIVKDFMSDVLLENMSYRGK